MSKEQLEEKISELEIVVRGWNGDNNHPDKDRILGDILQELKFFECKLALIALYSWQNIILIMLNAWNISISSMQ